MAKYRFVSVVEVEAENEKGAFDKLDEKLQETISFEYVLDNYACPQCGGVMLHKEGCPEMKNFEKMCPEV
jgi:hypothetical protein